MTGLLEGALRRVASLSPEEQDAIASQIIAALDGGSLDDEQPTEIPRGPGFAGAPVNF